FLPIETGAASFVLADKLAFCRFSFRDTAPPPELFRWIVHWGKPVLPSAIRIDMAPLKPDQGRVEPVSLTVPVHVTRHPTQNYEFCSWRMSSFVAARRCLRRSPPWPPRSGCVPCPHSWGHTEQRHRPPRRPLAFSRALCDRFHGRKHGPRRNRA